MSVLSFLIVIPRWGTFGLLGLLILQLIVAWRHAKKTGGGFRSTLLPNALAAAAVAIIFVREWFAYVPVWIDAPLVIVCLLLLLTAFLLWGVWLKRYVQEAWQLDERKIK